MKIILSRKGFDSSNGGCPSPILPDGTLLSMPIPSRKDSVKYIDLNCEGKSLFEIIKELNPRTKIEEKYYCHLDPDIRNYNVVENWQPLFGQEGASQTHLENQRVESGDIFLFFGWFRHAEFRGGKLRYVRNTSDVHILWGYLQIDAIYRSFDTLPTRFGYHPHAKAERFNKKNNSIYTAPNELSLDRDYRGSGTFNFNPCLVLSKKGFSRSKWQLPEFFKEVKVSYHSSKSFIKEGYFDSAKIGQEFVVSEDIRVTEWALSKIREGMNFKVGNRRV